MSSAVVHVSDDTAPAREICDFLGFARAHPVALASVEPGFAKGRALILVWSRRADALGAERRYVELARAHGGNVTLCTLDDARALSELNGLVDGKLNGRAFVRASKPETHEPAPAARRHHDVLGRSLGGGAALLGLGGAITLGAAHRDDVAAGGAWMLHHLLEPETASASINPGVGAPVSTVIAAEPPAPGALAADSVLRSYVSRLQEQEAAERASVEARLRAVDEILRAADPSALIQTLNQRARLAFGTDVAPMSRFAAAAPRTTAPAAPAKSEARVLAASAPTTLSEAAALQQISTDPAPALRGALPIADAAPGSI